MHPQLLRDVTEVDTPLHQCLNHDEVLRSQHGSLLLRSPNRWRDILAGGWGTPYFGAFRTYSTGADRPWASARRTSSGT
jgi:hypothetical protein